MFSPILPFIRYYQITLNHSSPTLIPFISLQVFWCKRKLASQIFSRMSTPAFTNDVANSPAITTITNDWIGEMLAGSVRNNIIIASVAAGVAVLTPWGTLSVGDCFPLAASGVHTCCSDLYPLLQELCCVDPCSFRKHTSQNKGAPR